MVASWQGFGTNFSCLDFGCRLPNMHISDRNLDLAAVYDSYVERDDRFGLFSVGLVAVSAMMVIAGLTTTLFERGGISAQAHTVDENMAVMETLSNTAASSGNDSSAASAAPAAVAVDDVPIEVQGAVCERDNVGSVANAQEIISLWNSTLTSGGDSCNADFRETLGRSWLMSDTYSATLGNGSSYEFLTTGTTVDALSFTIHRSDNQTVFGDRLSSAIDAVWGQGTIDWGGECETSSESWVGRLDAGSTVEIARCRR